MSDLSYLSRQLSYWQGRASNLDTQLRNLKRRKDDLEPIIKSLGKIATDDSENINRLIDKCSDSSRDAIENSGRRALYSVFYGKMDGGKLDGDINESLSKLQQEVRSIESSISACRTDLRYAEGQVASYKHEISEEQERQWTEKINGAGNSD